LNPVANFFEALTSPISADAFCGEDGSYDSDFELLKAEAEKLTETNWEAMVESGDRFLSKTSKDLRAFGFMLLAVGMTKGATALAQVARAYATVAMDHWEDVFPKRPNGRIQAVKWLVSDGVKTRLASITATGDYETLLAASDAFKKFQQFIFGKISEQPSFEGFTSILHDWAQKNKPIEAPPPPPPGSEPEPTAQPAQSGGLSLASEGDAYLALQTIGGFFYEKNKTHPLAYRLARMSRWAMLTELPPNQGGKTMIPAPYPDTLAVVRNLHAASDWQNLAENGEVIFCNDGMGFWFDLQRFICAALEGLGGDFPACAEAIKQELALLLKRVPGLETLAYDDGTAFADSATQEWLETEVAAALGGGTGGSPRKGKKKGDIAEESVEAEKLFAQERLTDALAVYKAGLSTDSSLKNNFERKLRMADLCLRGGKPTIAMTLCEELKRMVETTRIDAWDPDFCISLFRMLRRAYQTVSETGFDPTGELPARSLEALSSLARLDPLAAVQSE
jgi:type VI secretion system protein VasJ